MPSKKPKIQGIIEPHLYERFTEWRKATDLPHDGAGLNLLFSLFFNEPIEEIPENMADITVLNEKVNQLIAEMNEIKKLKETISKRSAERCDQFRSVDINGFNKRLSDLELAVSTSLQPIKSQNDIPQDNKDILVQTGDISRDNQDIQDKTSRIGSVVETVTVEKDSKNITSVDISQDNLDIQIEDRDIYQDTGDILVNTSYRDEENEDTGKGIDIQGDSKDISLSGVQLGKRLGCSEAAIRSHRKKGDLAKWTSERDPDGRGWTYKKGRYWMMP